MIDQQLDPNDIDLNDAYQTAKKFDQSPDFAHKAKSRVVALQNHERETYALWQTLVKISEQHFSDVYQQLNVLLDEADIRPESFYNPRLNPLIEDLSAQGICHIDDGAKVIYLDTFKDKTGKHLPFIIQKSDGGYLYATTDLAALDFRIHELKANRIIYVIDARQEQHFAMPFGRKKLVGNWQTSNSMPLIWDGFR